MLIARDSERIRRSDWVRGTAKLLSKPGVMVAAALTVRLVYLYQFFHNQPVPVGNRYVIGYETGSIAASLAAGHGYSSPLYVSSGPTAWITPVYPLVLAGIFKIFGIYTLNASIVIRCFNILCSGLTCYWVVLLGRKLFGNAAGVTAGWLWVILPYAIFFPVVWVWDASLTALLLMCCLLATYSIEERRDAWSWAGYGALWGFAALVNAAVLSVMPGCFLFATFRCRQRNPNWRKLAAFFALAWALTIAPWVVRNQIVFHGQVVFRSNFGLELWLGNNSQVPDTWTWWLHPSDDAGERAEFVRVGEVAYMQEKKAEAWAFIKSHPAGASRFIFHRFLETWTANRDSFADLWNSGVFLIRANLIINYLQPLLTFLGLLFARKKWPLLSLPLVNTIVIFPIIYYICHTTARYRHPIDPLVCVLSAYAAVYMIGAVRERWRPAVESQPAGAA